MTGVGNILLYVILLLVAPLFLISVVYCIYYRRKQPHCPICNSLNLTERTSSVSTAYMGEKGLERVGDNSAEITIPIETSRTQSLAPQRPSLNLQWLKALDLVLIYNCHNICHCSVDILRFSERIYQYLIFFSQ